MTATRRVFIVTRPLKLPLLSPRQNSWPTVDLAPRITGSLDLFGLTKHWEMCVEGAPGSSDNFNELFYHACYFGAVGSSLWKGGDGKLSWDLDQVASIEAVELVGETRLSDAEINEIGKQLKDGWGDYLFTQRNCQDYSIQLAHIVMEGDGGGLTRSPILRDLIALLATCRGKLVTPPRLPLTAAARFMMGPMGSAAATAIFMAELILQKRRERAEARLRAQFPELCALQISCSGMGSLVGKGGFEMRLRQVLGLLVPECFSSNFGYQPPSNCRRNKMAPRSVLY